MNLFKDINFKNPKTICALACIAFMLLIVLMQFWPGVWGFSQMDQISEQQTNETASIMELVWFPKSNNGAYATFFDGTTVGLLNTPVTRNQVAIMPAGQLLMAAFGIVLIIKYPRATIAGLFPIVCGILGFYGYFLIEGFRVHFTWYINVALAVLSLLSGLVYMLSGTIFKNAD